MAKKKRDGKPRREPTRRQISHWEKEKKRQRIIFITGVFIIAAVICVTLGGWIATRYLPLREVVIKVNDTKFTMGYYIDILELYGGSRAIAMTDEVAKAIKQSELIRQDAVKLGITVSEDEVKKELENLKQSLSKKYVDSMRTDLLIKKMQNDYFEQKVPVSTTQRHVMAMLLESENQAKEARKRLENGEDFSKLAEELSVEDYTKAHKGDLGWRPEGILKMVFPTPKLEEHAFSAEVGKVSEPVFDPDQIKSVGYWILRVLERKEDPKQAHIQGILLGNAEQAKSVKEKLDAGGNFGALAKELSLHVDSKDAEGEMGWVTPDRISKAVADYVFDTKIELRKLSGPIRDDKAPTEGGYWLIKVTEIDPDRKIEDENRNLLKNKLLTDWIDSLWTNPDYKIEDKLDDAKKAWAVKQVQQRVKSKPVAQR